MLYPFAFLCKYVMTQQNVAYYGKTNATNHSTNSTWNWIAEEHATCVQVKYIHS